MLTNPPFRSDISFLGCAIDFMRVVLATPPEYRHLSTPAQVLGPPMGLMYMASYARRFGFLKEADASIEISDAFTQHLNSVQFAQEMVTRKPDVVGITLTSRMFLVGMASLSRIKKALPETRIVLGGIHPTFTAERIVRYFPFVDCVIKGEAERAFSQLLQYYAGKMTDASTIPGITKLEDGRMIDNPPDTIGNLDEMPFPARDLVENVRYGYTWGGIDLTYGKFTAIVTSRGCPFNCNFCTNWLFSNRKLRVRSIENVVSELELIESEGYKSCVIVDDIFTANKKRVIELCNEIKRRKIDLVLYCEGRVDEPDPAMFAAMKRAGISSILFGIESGSQKILDHFHKGTSPNKAREAVANARAAGLYVIGAFIIGSPIENADDIRDTLLHIEELDLDGLEVNALGISPWDLLYKQADAEGKVGEYDWMRDHLVSEYYGNLPLPELAEWVEQAYYAFFRRGVTHNMGKLFRYILRSRDARSAIIRNLRNPYALRLVRERGKARHKIEEILLSGTDEQYLWELAPYAVGAHQIQRDHVLQSNPSEPVVREERS